MADMVLKVQRRTQMGKEYSKRLRREGWIPGIFYGAGEVPIPLELDRKAVENVIRRAGRNALISLVLNDEQESSFATLLQEIQHHPISGEIIHADLHRVVLTEKVRIQVPVVIHGVADGVRNQGGVLEHVTHRLDVECLPTAIPAHIEVDVSALRVGGSVRVESLLSRYPEIITDPEEVVLTIVSPTRAPEPEELIVEEEEKEEPEVIGEKREEEEE